MQIAAHQRTTRTCRSGDGHPISYDVVGDGPPLLLLHGGFVHDRTMWREAGYVAALSTEFRSIIPDLRGHGASPHLTTAADYALDRVLGDLRAVLAAECVERVLILGYSLGAVVGLRFALAHGATAGLVLLGGAFGAALPEPMRQAVLERLDEVESARRRGESPALSPAEQAFVTRADLRVVRAAYTAFADWPSVDPQQLPCPTAFITGSENPWSMASLHAHAAQFAACGVVAAVLPGLSHDQELTETEAVLRITRPFLEQHAERAPRASP